VAVADETLLHAVNASLAKNGMLRLEAAQLLVVASVPFHLASVALLDSIPTPIELVLLMSNLIKATPQISDGKL
jgi:hypothetical protein